MRVKVFFSIIFLTACLVYVGAADEQGETVKVAGEWSITITFISGTGHHTAFFEQKGDSLSGVYKGEFKEGTLTGEVKGNTIDFTGRLKHEATRLNFHYTGTISGDTMKGTVDMGEYWTARWTARRARKKEGTTR